MPHFRLKPLSERALDFASAGSHALVLPTNRLTRIGRAPDSDIRLPPDWIQISTRWELAQRAQSVGHSWSRPQASAQPLQFAFWAALSRPNKRNTYQ